MRKIVSRLRGSLCRLLTLLFFVSLATSSAAQAKAKKPVRYPCDKLIESGEFDKAYADIQKHVTDSSDVKYLYSASVLFSTPAFSAYDLKAAYDYLALSREAYTDMSDSKKEKFKNKGFSPSFLAKAFARISRMALDTAIVLNTVADYDYYLVSFPKSPREDRKTATILRDALAFSIAVNENTLAAFDTFLVHYPKSREFAAATAKRDSIAFSEFDAVGTVKAYQDFIKKYPRAREVTAAMEHLFLFAYEEEKLINPKFPAPKIDLTALKVDKSSIDNYMKATSSGRLNKYFKYIKDNPKNNVVNALAQIEIWSKANQLQDTAALQYCIENFRTSLRDSSLFALHKVYERADDIRSFEAFYRKYGNMICSDELRKLREKDEAAMYARANASTEEFIRAAAPYNSAYVALRQLVDGDIKNGCWVEAQKTITQFADVFGGDYRYRNLLRVTRPKLDERIKVTRVEPVSHAASTEYAPVVTADTKKMYYCTQGSWCNEEIFVAERDGEKWVVKEFLKEINTDKYNEAVLSVSTDGLEMIMFQDGMMKTSSKRKKGWSKPSLITSRNINVCKWQADAMITSDGMAMLFAARKASPHELDSETCIYVSESLGEDRWGEPIDLGPIINQGKHTRAPFLHPDMRTLYFCSYGHGGLGGYDVFMSRRLRDDSWTEWSEPINLGREINSEGDDWWYRITTDGKYAYYSKIQEEELKKKIHLCSPMEDIFRVDLPEDVKPDPVATVSGYLTDANGKPVSATLYWEDLRGHICAGKSRSDPEDGSYFFVLPLGKNYGYYISDAKYFPVAHNIDLANKHTPQIIEKDLDIVTLRSMLTDSVPVSLNNLFFEPGDSTILPDSHAELQRVVLLINKYRRPVEISGHSDDRGSDAQNQKLSEGRAREVMRFLIIQGCDPSLLRAVGYGKTRPKASNMTEQGRRKNRRVDIRFLKK